MLWGGVPASRTAVLTDFLKKLTKNAKTGFEHLYLEHFCVPETMVASVSAQTAVLTDFRKKHPAKPLTKIEGAAAARVCVFASHTTHDMKILCQHHSKCWQSPYKTTYECFFFCILCVEVIPLHIGK